MKKTSQQDPFEDTLRHFLSVWKLDIVETTFNSRRFRDPLDHILNKKRYAAGKHNAVYLVKEKRGLFRRKENPLWVLRISKEPLPCKHLKNDLRIHKELANRGIALGFKSANVRPFEYDLCYQAVLLPFAHHTLASFVSSRPSALEVSPIAAKVTRLIWSIASKGYFFDDILPQNIVIMDKDVFVIDIESSEVEENLRKENQTEYATQMFQQVMRSLVSLSTSNSKVFNSKELQSIFFHAFQKARP